MSKTLSLAELMDELEKVRERGGGLDSAVSLICGGVRYDAPQVWTMVIDGRAVVCIGDDTR
jgi:hypothetical protein